jgi:hypothetical protein
MASSYDAAMQAAATIVAAQINKAIGPVNQATVGKWLVDAYDTVRAAANVLQLGVNTVQAQDAARARIDTRAEEILEVIREM